MACDDKHEACALLLLQAGALADVEDDWSDTPRTVATKQGLANAVLRIKPFVEATGPITKEALGHQMA